MQRYNNILQIYNNTDSKSFLKEKLIIIEGIHSCTPPKGIIIYHIIHILCVN